MTVKRVVVWGTGFVGRLVIPEILPHPEFELVGVGVSNPDKVGQDAVALAGALLVGGALALGTRRRSGTPDRA
jgi:hypothetical protein